MFTFTHPFSLLSPTMWWSINICLSFLLLLFALSPRTRRAFSNPEHDHTRQNLWLSLTIGLSVIWLMRAELMDVFYLHFIGASLAYLLLGVPLAGLALAVVLVFTGLTRHIPVEIWGAQYVLSGLLPLLLAYGLHRLIARFLPKRLFAFIFVHGFFVTALSMMLTVFVNFLALQYFSVISLNVGNEVYWISPILLGWGEAFLTGMIIALIAVYRPYWLHREAHFTDV